MQEPPVLTALADPAELLVQKAMLVRQVLLAIPVLTALAERVVLLVQKATMVT
jgi:hypothetical protein